uniref:Protein rolling stone n=1 Tax=Cacopsylla melanoneura TaxID=428564 RepID=A0A8D8QEZ0_9HEMI
MAVTSLAISIVSYDTWLYFIYLTHWSYILIVLQSLLGSYLITARFLQQDSYDRESIQLSELEWGYGVLFTMALAQAPGISLLYWFLEDRPVEITWVSHMEHTFNSVVMLIEFLLNGAPLQASYFYWTFLFNGVYIAFSVVYHWMGGINMNGQAYIYRLLDWHHVNTALIMCCMALSMFLVLHFTAAFLSKVKFWLCNKLVPKRLLTLPNKVTLV